MKIKSYFESLTHEINFFKHKKKKIDEQFKKQKLNRQVRIK